MAEELGIEDGIHSLDCFDFDDDLIGNQQVDAMFANLLIFVVYGNRQLPRVGNPTQIKFAAKSTFINGFE